jgi:hypothetical protein
MKLIDRTNQKYGKLTVISRAPDATIKGGQKRIMWRCLCECGAETIVGAANLANGHTKSCGCKVREACSKSFKRHGQTETKAYRAWCLMKTRCTNPSVSTYVNYGARGIKICDKWFNSFEAFLSDMGHPPSPTHSLDRINSDGNYEPGNCRWSDPYEQSNNRRNNNRYTLGDKTMNESQWARELDLSVSALRCRIKNWPLEKALSTPRMRN